MIGSEFLWPGRFHARAHISTRQYSRLLKEWVSYGLRLMDSRSVGFPRRC